ncbi:MAG TPA: heavy metal-associated domain-containing protein [Gemmatimonadaceae bacterium]|nr:heavy metal-associated domain-containing protein [Gemmatimonadaceae bacterium]
MTEQDVEADSSSGHEQRAAPVITTRVNIAGMTSVHSAHAVFTALTGVDGILRADVAVGRATIEHDGRATCEALAQAIAVAGYVMTDCIEERRRLPLL